MFERPRIVAGKGGPALVGARFRPGGKRREEDVEAITLVGLDVDEGEPFTADELRERLEGLRYVAYPSYRSTSERPRWRVLLPLAAPVEPERADAIHAHFAALLDDRIGDAHEPHHPWYMPMVPPARKAEYVCLIGEGEAFDARELPDAPSRVRRAKGRNDALISAAGTLRNRGFTDSELRHAVDFVNDRRGATDPRGPLPEREAAKVSKSADDRERDFPHTDRGNAERMAATFCDRLRWCGPRKRWLWWDGVRWSWSDEAAMRAAKATVRAMVVEALGKDDEARLRLTKWATASESARKLKDMAELCRTEDGVPIDADALDTDPWLLGVRNGVLNLKGEVELLEPDPESMVTMLAPIDYEPKARCPTWDAYLRRVQPDAAMRAFLQRAAGYTLTGYTMEKVLFFLFSDTPDCGKTTFVETLQALLGDYAHKTDIGTFLRPKFQGSGPSPERVALRRRRLVVTSELGSGQRLNEPLIKDVTGGLDKLSARFHHEGMQEFRPEMKLWMYGNKKPKVRGDDAALWRRVLVVPFEVSIPREQQDGALDAKLLRELPGILNWALAGLAEYHEVGLRPPERVYAATAAYREEMDPVGQQLKGQGWATSRLRAVPLTTMYDSWNSWRDKNNVRDTLTIQQYSAELAAKGYVVKAGQTDNKTVVMARRKN